MKRLLFSAKNAPEELKEKAEHLVQKVLKSGVLTVRTSGSTGEPKEISIPLDEIEASAERTRKALHLKEGAVLCSLPLDYIAGIMQVFRAYFWQRPLAMVEPSLDPLQHWVPEETALGTFTTMQWLKMVARRNQMVQPLSCVILGGSAVPDDIPIAEGYQGALYASYGMTETVSHIALRQLYPTRDAHYKPLPDVKVKRDASSHTLLIKVGDKPWVQTTDIAHISSHGFSVSGRVDNVLISGGLKVQPEPLEQLYAKALNCDAVVVGVPDKKYGQKIVLVINNNKSAEEIRDVSAELQRPQEAPRAFTILSHFPKTRTGKIDRSTLLAALIESELQTL